MVKIIISQLRVHSPFTIFGATTGIIIMAFCHQLPSDISYRVFYILHPAHVVFSALVTTSMYALHGYEYPGNRYLRGKCNLRILFVIGYVGSIGIATLSDSFIPYIGETLLRMPNRGIHLGFIEMWWLVNPLAVLGIIIAYFKPTTKVPHGGHVLLSTWASLFHIIMALTGSLTWFMYGAVFLFLFLAVWFPCCLSDIIFPLLFVKKGMK